MRVSHFKNILICLFKSPFVNHHIFSSFNIILAKHLSKNINQSSCSDQKLSQDLQRLYIGTYLSFDNGQTIIGNSGNCHSLI